MNNNFNGGAGADTASTLNEKITSIFNQMEECIQKLKSSSDEEHSKTAIESFRSIYKEAKRHKDSMTEKQWAVVAVKVDVMKKIVNRKSVETLQPLPSPVRGVKTKKYNLIPSLPRECEYRPLIFISTDGIKFAGEMAESLLSDEECIELAGRWLEHYQSQCTPVEISEYKTAMCNTVMRSRHEDEWEFRWYGEKHLNPNPSEWPYYLDAVPYSPVLQQQDEAPI